MNQLPTTVEEWREYAAKITDCKHRTRIENLIGALELAQRLHNRAQQALARNTQMVSKRNESQLP